MMKLKLVVAALVAMLLILSGCASAPPGPRVKLKFVNNSGVWLAFYVDGVKAANVGSGNEADTTVTVGYHKLHAETSNGKQSVNHNSDIGENGVTWEVTPPHSSQ